MSANFVGANLTGANFSGATITAADSALPSDFSFADLTSACFQRATIGSPTYFTYAALRGADSRTPRSTAMTSFSGRSRTSHGTPVASPAS